MNTTQPKKFSLPPESLWRAISSLNGFLGVAMGAVARHAVTDPALSSLAEDAAKYQLVHAVVLLCLADRPDKGARVARRLLLSGILFFCGSLYVKALSNGAVPPALAPVGGICFMAGWLVLALMPGRVTPAREP